MAVRFSPSSKKDPDLRRIPVVVLTTSTSDEDITESYDLRSNCYV